MGNVYTRDVSSLRRIYSTEQETGSRIHEIEWEKDERWGTECQPGSWCDPMHVLYVSLQIYWLQRQRTTVPYFRYRLWWRSSLSMMRMNCCSIFAEDFCNMLKPGCIIIEAGSADGAQQRKPILACVYVRDCMDLDTQIDQYCCMRWWLLIWGRAS